LSGSGNTYAVGSADTTSGLSNISRALSTLGVGLKQAEALPGFDALRQALPMVQALLEMMVIISLPLLMMFSAYEPKTAITISFALFALMFVSFWWELAGWLDDRLITILYDTMEAQGIGDSTPAAPFVGFFSSTSDGWIMNLVLGSMYLVFPMVWVGMLSWTGAYIGNIFSSAIQNASQSAQSAGEKGGKMAQDLAIKKVTGQLGAGINNVTKR
jgi:hypothetical protein